MPKGMFLKSDAFASNLSAPCPAADLESFSRARAIAYHPTAVPVPLALFSAYGLDFQNRFVPALEDDAVTRIARSPGGFQLSLQGGGSFEARRVVLAVGLTHFDHVPSVLAGLPRPLASHSSAHHDLTAFRGREVAVIGGGSSAVDLAALLAEAGAEPTLIARSARLRFFSPPRDGPERWWRRLRKPPSGLGPGWRSRFYADAPGVFHAFPARLRRAIVRRHLGPASAWPLQARVSGVPTLLQHRLAGAEVRGSRVRLGLRNGADLTKTMDFDHVIAGTGYRPDLVRLDFLDAELRDGVSTLSGSPTLTNRFESTVGGLFFLGAASAMSFGPVMRFVFGADFASRTLSAHLTRPRP